jgi:hypothetical protein
MKEGIADCDALSFGLNPNYFAATA